MSSSPLGSPRPPLGLTEEASASGQCGPAAAGTAASAAVLLILRSLGILAREALTDSHSEAATLQCKKGQRLRSMKESLGQAVCT